MSLLKGYAHQKLRKKLSFYISIYRDKSFVIYNQTRAHPVY